MVMKHYYIVTPEKEIFGPYNASEKATFSINENINYVKDIEVMSDLFDSYVKGLFYEKVDDGYKIWNKQGTSAYEEIVDYAEPISNNAMKIKKDGKLGVVNNKLELVLFGDFEDVTNVINQRAYVKQNGEWKLIEIKLDEAEIQEREKKKKIVKAYKDQILQIKNNELDIDYLVEYSLYDIDSDAIPELILKTGHGEYDYMYHIYTYKEDACVFVGEISAGHTSLEYDSEEKGMLKSYGSMGNQVITKIMIEDDNLVEEEIFSQTDGSLVEYIRHQSIPVYNYSDMTGFDEY